MLHKLSRAHKRRKSAIAGAAIALVAGALTVPVATAATAATPADGFVTITQDAPKEAGTYVAGDVLSFTVTVTNDTAVNRAYKLGGANLANFGKCQWINLAAGQTVTCPGLTYTVNQLDIVKGTFAPAVLLTQYAGPAYTTASADFATYTGDAVNLAAPATGALADDFVSIELIEGEKAPGTYVTGDVLRFNVTLTNNTNTARPYKVIGANLAKYGSCQFSSLAANQSADCDQLEYTLTKVDIDRGSFTPQLVLRQYAVAGDWTSASADFAPFSGEPVVLFEQTANLTVSPEQVTANGTVTVTGTGFTPGETVKFAGPAGSTVDLTADANGAATWSYVVPADTAAGTVLRFAAQGQTSQQYAEITAEVTAPAATETPTPSASQTPVPSTSQSPVPAASTADEVPAKDGLAITGADGLLPLAALSVVLLAGSLVAFVLRRKQSL